VGLGAGHRAYPHARVIAQTDQIALGLGVSRRGYARLGECWRAYAYDLRRLAGESKPRIRVGPTAGRGKLPAQAHSGQQCPTYAAAREVSSVKPIAAFIGANPFEAPGLVHDEGVGWAEPKPQAQW
jgi:hypothetical protein